MRLISLRDDEAYLKTVITYFQKQWGSEHTMMIYDDCISHCVDADNPLPQWYLLMDIDQDNKEVIVGCAGLITNDFISRMDLYPWICALYIEEAYRGNKYGEILIESAKLDAFLLGFEKIYVATDHIGYYEKYGFSYIGTGYHPWNETSRIYEACLADHYGK